MREHLWLGGPLVVGGDRPGGASHARDRAAALLREIVREIVARAQALVEGARVVVRVLGQGEVGWAQFG